MWWEIWPALACGLLAVVLGCTWFGLEVGRHQGRRQGRQDGWLDAQEVYQVDRAQRQVQITERLWAGITPEGDEVLMPWRLPLEYPPDGIDRDTAPHGFPSDGQLPIKYHTPSLLLESPGQREFADQLAIWKVEVAEWKRQHP
jgi:hypothetical protein